MRILPQLSALLSIIALFLGDAAGAQPVPAAPEGGAVVWYLGHCGYAIRTRDHLLIFDYQEEQEGRDSRVRPEQPSLDNGWIVPAQLGDLKIRVFVSHSHRDHYDPVILSWRETIMDIQYFFGWQASEDPANHYLVGPKGSLEIDGLRIDTVNSHHSGVPEVAWLVQVDGLVIYHNGDCQVDYPSDFPYLQTRSRHIDLAFVPCDFNERDHYSRQNADFFERFRPGAVFPMHDSAENGQYGEFERVILSRFPDLPLVTPKRLGESFLYQNGRIIR